MEYQHCFNTCNNTSYRQRSQTLHRDHKYYMVERYLQSLRESNIDTEQRASYANVPSEVEQAILMRQPDHLHPIPRQHPLPHLHVHNRSHSHHYYNTMSHVPNYDNISGPIRPACSRRHSPVNEPTRVHNVDCPDQLDTLTMIQVCNELGYVDSSPPMPSTRNYTLYRLGQNYYKFSFPQRRRVKTSYTDPSTGILLKQGDWITVHGISKTDRSKFYVCYNQHHFDLPHQYTHFPDPSWT